MSNGPQHDYAAIYCDVRPSDGSEGMTYRDAAKKHGCSLRTVQNAIAAMEAAEERAFANDVVVVDDDLPHIGVMRAIPRDRANATWSRDYVLGSVVESLELLAEVGKPRLRWLIENAEKEGDQIRALSELRQLLQFEVGLLGGPAAPPDGNAEDDDVDEEFVQLLLDAQRGA